MREAAPIARHPLRGVAARHTEGSPGVGASNGSHHHLDAARTGGDRRPPNGSWAGRYGTRPATGRVQRLRDLARAGRLAAVAAAAGGEERLALTGAAYDVAWPIVFARVTRRVEQRRGHPACAAGVDRLADECLDRFHDDVEAVVDDLLAHARHPVQHLEGWIAGRLTAATVNGHRRLRGERGALQRPRLPGWLAGALGHDRWRTKLAVEILVWVGEPVTAGTEVWPLEAWAQRRGALTGDWAGSNPAVVAREVDGVLVAMRQRPEWYASYVERPLGGKRAPVATAPPAGRTGEMARPLDLRDPDARVDAEMLRLAAEAVRAIDHRLARGEQAERIVVEVIRTVFGGPFTGTLDAAPHDAADPLGGLTTALADGATVDRIVATVLGIIGDRGHQTQAAPYA